MSELNILVLHGLGNPQNTRAFLKHHVFLLKNYFPEHNYLYHDIALPLPEYVQQTAFHAILLDVTFLCWRWASAEQFQNLKQAYQFVRHCDAVKIAFPQDEYDCHELLDEWMCDWDVDIVYSVLASGWNVLYPAYHARGRIELGYTGYVDESLLKRSRKAFAERTIDIGYRATKLPPYFGRIGEVKHRIGLDVLRRCEGTGLRTDIVVGERGILNGDAWIDFIGNCRFTLGTNSGSSLLDPRGEIQRRVRAYLSENPGASFEEVEEHCFKGLDGRHSFTAISPRVLEAALLDSCQVLVRGEYSGIIQPWEHYLPIQEDASDFPDILRCMQDSSLVQRIIHNCRAAILQCSGLSYAHTGRELLARVEHLARRKNVASNSRTVRRIIRRYHRRMDKRYYKLWRRQAGLYDWGSVLRMKCAGIYRRMKSSFSFSRRPL